MLLRCVLLLFTLNSKIIVTSLMPHSFKRYYSWSTFPGLGSTRCIVPESLQQQFDCFLCDPESVFGLSYPLKFTEAWRGFWNLCSDECSSSKALFNGARPRLAIAIVKDLLISYVGGPSSHVLGTIVANEWRAWLNQTIQRFSSRFDDKRCPVDVLALVAVRAHLCTTNACATLPRVSISVKYSHTLHSLLRNRSKTVQSSDASLTNAPILVMDTEYALGTLLMQTVQTQQELIESAVSSWQSQHASVEGSRRSNSHSVPRWAVILFIACIIISLGSAYLGHYISQTHGACLDVCSRSGRGGSASSRRWKAGFVGGMLEMQNIAGAGVARPRSTRAGVFSFKPSGGAGAGRGATRAGGMVSAMNTRRKY